MKYKRRRKHKAYQLITVWTKYTLSVTRLRQNTEITVWVFAVRKFSLEQSERLAAGLENSFPVINMYWNRLNFGDTIVKKHSVSFVNHVHVV